MTGYWMKPSLARAPDGGNLIAGPLQLNWYNHGLRLHVTWPGRTRTFTLR